MFILNKKKARKIEALLVLKAAFNDLIIYKRQPPKLSAMQKRLDRRLSQISKKIVDRALSDKFHTYNEWDDSIRAMYKEHMIGVSRIGVETIINTPKIDLTVNDFRWNKLDAIMEDRAFNASERTISRMNGDVLSKIEEGIREGRSLAKTDKELAKQFTDMTQKELHRISRTETHSVYQQSKHQAIIESSALGKKWVHGNAITPREWHVDMDGEVVECTPENDEPFSNGLLYPGDPSGDAEEVINCGCDMVPDIRFGR